jgi:hypothetical protein
MLAILGYLRDGTGENTGTGTGASTGTGTGRSLDKGSGSKEDVQVQVRRRMVTYAEWARRGQANPCNLSFSPSLVARVR